MSVSGEQTSWLVQLVGLGLEPHCWEGTSHPSCHQLDQLGGRDPGSILPQRRKLGTDAILSSPPNLNSSIISPRQHLNKGCGFIPGPEWGSRASLTPSLTLPVLQASSVQRNLLKSLWVTELKMGLCVSSEPPGPSAKLTG